MGAGGLPILGAIDIGALSDDGVEIGAHSMTHPQLDAVGRGRAWREILDSKNALEAIVGRPVETFAYPHGYHDRATKKMVADAGYTSAAAVRNALSHAGDDRFALARYTVMADCTAEHLAGVLDGRHARRAPRRERLRTAVWREVRRFRARSGAMTVQTALTKPLVVSPVPRDKWRSVLAGDPLALPEHSPEWIDALTDDGRYRDASRLYTFADGREAILPLVARRGLAGIGGWLLSYPFGLGHGRTGRGRNRRGCCARRAGGPAPTALAARGHPPGSPALAGLGGSPRRGRAHDSAARPRHRPGRGR